MKCFSLCTLFFCVLALCAAIPVPPTNDGKPPVDKGKARAIDPPSPPPSRPRKPKPKKETSVPLPGRSGLHTDPVTGVVTMYYGDDKLPEHMGHLQRNQDAFPHNRNPNRLSVPSEHNRDNALEDVPFGPLHPVTGLPMVRDEKLPNMLHNPHHSTSTTVEYLHRYESNIEGGYTSNFKKLIQALPNGQGQLRPNPGWLPLHPDQRRGHEAPARLNTQHPADGTPFKKPSDAQIKASKKSAYKLGKHLPPLVVGPHGMEMPRKKGNPKPKPKPSTSGANNLRQGQVLPLEHVWQPHDQKIDEVNKEKASHKSVPGHLKDAEQRHPPRPQNRDVYLEQQKAATKAEATHKAGAPPRAHSAASMKLPTLPKDKLDQYKKNLALFENGLPARHGGAVGRAHEAPARTPTHWIVSRPRVHSEPQPGAQGHQPTAPSPPAHAGPSSPHPPSAHGHHPTAPGPQAQHSGPSNPHPQHPHHGSKPEPKARPSRKK